MVLTDIPLEIQEAILNILTMYGREEERNWKEDGKPADGHVYLNLKKVDRWMKDAGLGIGGATRRFDTLDPLPGPGGPVIQNVHPGRYQQQHGPSMAGNPVYGVWDDINRAWLAKGLTRDQATNKLIAIKNKFRIDGFWSTVHGRNISVDQVRLSVKLNPRGHHYQSGRY